MLKRLFRFLFKPKTHAYPAILSGQILKDEEEEKLKNEMNQRLHDQATRLHVLEWKADVEGRRIRTRSESQK